MKGWLSRSRLLELVLILLVISAGVARRMHYLDVRPFWVDESESSINALTILQHGVPVDHYLGLPIFENTLIKPWPASREYEFKDISYSDRGLATYHGWLPLYSMAASFALYGIHPDQPNTGFLIHRSLNELKRRSRAGRFPAVLFSALFLALCYVGGTALLGRDAGWTALLVGCVHQTQIDLATIARYYSATVTLSTAVLLCLWLVWTKGQWKHYVLASCAFVLLFYTHLVTFAAGILVLCILTPFVLWRQPGSLKKFTVFAVILGLCTIPWIFATGFLSGLGYLPPARLLLSFPAALFNFPLARPIYFLFFGAFAILILWALPRRSNMPARVRGPLRQSVLPVAILSLWILCGYASFMLFMPAASFFPQRLNLSYWGPTLLLGSVFCAVASRILLPRFSLLTAPLLAFLLLAVSGHNLRAEHSPETGQSWGSLATVVRHLQAEPLLPSTRLYASPNEHLNLAFYTGLPFQSIMPIRKSFLDGYPGDIIYVERIVFPPATGSVAPVNLKRAASLSGQTLADTDAQEISRVLRTRAYRLVVNHDILAISECPKESLPPYARKAAALQDKDGLLRNSDPDLADPIFRGFKVRNWQEWRSVFFYRFVDPLSRSGPKVNYAGRLRGSDADILVDEEWTIYYFKIHRSHNGPEVRFRIFP